MSRINILGITSGLHYEVFRDVARLQYTNGITPDPSVWHDEKSDTYDIGINMDNFNIIYKGASVIITTENYTMTIGRNDFYKIEIQ